MTRNPADDTIGNVVHNFQSLYGDRCSDPAWARDRCACVSELFARHLNEAAIPAEVIDGLEYGEVPEFPGVELILNGHYAVLAPERMSERGEWIGQKVYDWTAVQFDRNAPVPVVQDLAEWRSKWRAPASGNEH